MSIIKKGSFIERKTYVLEDTYQEPTPQSVQELNVQESKSIEPETDQTKIVQEIRPIQPPGSTLNKQKVLDELQLEMDDLKQKTLDEIANLKDQANSEIQSLKENAQAEVENIRNKAHEEGYNAGHQQGIEEYTSKTLELTKQINDLGKEKKRIFRETEAEVLKMSLKIAEQLIRSEISLNQAVTMNIVTEAISKITDRDKVIVKVSKTDYDYVHSNKDRIHHLVDDIKTLVIQEDSTIESGGCIIETDLGYIDSRISMKLEAIEKAMQKVYSETYEEELQQEEFSKQESNEEQPSPEAEETIAESIETVEEEQPAEDIDDSEVYDSFDQIEESSDENEDDDFFDFDDDWE